MAVRTPPTKPSQVLFGDTDGAIGRRPRVLPHTYWNTSEPCTTSSRNSSSRAPASPPDPGALPSATCRPCSMATGSCSTAGMCETAYTHTMAAHCTAAARRRNPSVRPASAARTGRNRNAYTGMNTENIPYQCSHTNQ